MSFLRILVVAAIAFGAYTLGARAGRGRYRTIKKNAKKAWESPSARKARRVAGKTTKQGRRKLDKKVRKVLT